MEALRVTDMNLKTIKSKMKSQEERGVDSFQDRSKCSKSTIENVKRTASSCALVPNKLSREQESMLIIKNSSSVFIAKNWFTRFFNLVGDQMPNTEGEIHLEACDYCDLYDQYEFDMINVYMSEEYLSYTKWREVWNEHFQHVRVREYKQGTGKCDEGEMLSDARKKIRSTWGRQLITDCHGFHR